MGWGTDFTMDLFLNKETYKTVGEVEDEIESELQTIEHTKLQITVLLLMQKIPNEFAEEPANYVTMELRNLFEFIEDSTKHIKMLELYARFLEEQQNED